MWRQPYRYTRANHAAAPQALVLPRSADPGMPRATDGELQLVIDAPLVLRIFTVTGVDRYFRHFPSLPETLAASPRSLEHDRPAMTTSTESWVAAAGGHARLAIAAWQRLHRPSLTADRGF
jgi:hypothetical protein